MKSLKVKKSDVGCFVRVVFEESGAMDGIITDANHIIDGEFYFLPFCDLTGSISNNGAPAIAIGNPITCKNSGLDK